VRENIFGDLDHAMTCGPGTFSQENERLIRGAVGLDAYHALRVRHACEEFPVIYERSASLATRF